MKRLVSFGILSLFFAVVAGCSSDRRDLIKAVEEKNIESLAERLFEYIVSGRDLHQRFEDISRQMRKCDNAGRYSSAERALVELDHCKRELNQAKVKLDEISQPNIEHIDRGIEIFRELIAFEERLRAAHDGALPEWIKENRSWIFIERELAGVPPRALLNQLEKRAAEFRR